MRRPLDRLFSHAVHGDAAAPGALDDARAADDDRADERALRDVRSSWWWRAEPNFAVARLCGACGAAALAAAPNATDCDGAGGLGDGAGAGAARLACAQARLARFSVVLVTEQLDLGAPLLERAFGWPAPEAAARAGSRKGVDAAALVARAFGGGARGEAALRALRERHALDGALHAFAARLMCAALRAAELPVDVDRADAPRNDAPWCAAI